MADWSAWRQFPDPKAEGYLKAPFGPGVYELRHRSTDGRIYVGESKTVAKRMTSLLPKSHGGAGTRNNSCLREYVAERLAEIEYRTRACATDKEAKRLERRMHDTHTYICPT